MNKKIKNRIFYGCGVVGPAIFETFLGSFLTLYATDVLGIDALRFASLLIIPRIIDILIDIFIMYFIGKTKSKYGMYRPWLLNTIIIGITFSIIFSIKSFNLSNSLTLTIIFIAYLIGCAICDSFYWISYIALPGIITDNEDELLGLSSSKSIFDYFFSTFVSIISMPILLMFGDYKNPKGWMILSLILSIISITFSLLCFFNVKTDSKLERKMIKEYSIKDILNDYKYIIKNKSFICNSLLLVFTNIIIYIFATISYYFYIYNLNIENEVAYLAIIATFIAIITSIFTGKVKKKYGLKNTLYISIISLIISSILMAFTYNFITMVISGTFYMIGSVSIITLLFSLWPSISSKLDNNKVKSPLNNTIGLSNIFINMSIIIANLIGSLIISFSKYDYKLTKQSNFTLNTIRYSTPLFILVLSLIMLIIIKRKEEE